MHPAKLAAPKSMLTARFHPAIAELPAATWDALRASANPFVSHAFAAVDQGQVGLLKVGDVKGTMSH